MSDGQTGAERFTSVLKNGGHDSSVSDITGLMDTVSMK